MMPLLKYNNILCIRPDNLGDLLMSSPAIRALKETFQAKITVLTSSMAAGAAPLIAEIDEVMVCDFPWVKTSTPDDQGFLNLIPLVRERNFDLAVVFTVYSQNPLPAVMLAYLSGIPSRLAYCRENPYELLTHWVPDREPYTYIKHQVRRDLDLVAKLGASSCNEALRIREDQSAQEQALSKLLQAGVNIQQPWLIFHAGVSEQKRAYPNHLWIETAKTVINSMNYQILYTGSAKEKPLTDQLATETGKNSFSLGGWFVLNEFAELIRKSPLVISVNTGTVHLAAATNTPVVVLYALTNPQHAPWKALGQILPFSPP
ncbi:glycosyltransferase family 9 protein, partial [Arcticibacter sp.]|uniref:glycosyltransferase family 9 protein n=1 Tax=Arcticibacter sp. TaxID=1872630 RepID=UPI00388FEE86